MPRFGPKRDRREDNVDRDDPSTVAVLRAVEQDHVETVSDLAAELDITKDHARTRAMDAGVYGDIWDPCPGDRGDGDGA